jgi:Holliday junction resolvase-like predicted endonuclease
MAVNFLEQLVAEWYEYQGYFIRRNVRVGKVPGGGYECELDVVAFHPETKHLVHVEPSTDAGSWEERERRYSVRPACFRS